MRALLIAAFVVPQTLGNPAIDVSKLAVSAETTICELDMGTLRGEMRRLSWSLDNQYIHLQTVEDRALRDYIVDLYDGTLSVAYGEPEWAASYWKMKSNVVSPGLPSLRLEMSQRVRRDTSKPAIPAANPGGAYQPQGRPAIESEELQFTLKMVGEDLGFWMHEAPNPGETFGWGPPASGAIVFADRDGRVVFLDQAKRRQIVAGTKGASMPAWSPDGTRVVYVLKSGRRKLRLVSVTVTPRD